MFVIDFAVVDLCKQRHHLLVQHGGVELSVERWMPESFFKFVALVVRSLGINFGEANFFFSRVEVVELREIHFVDVDLVKEDEEDGRDGGDPLIGCKSELKTHSCAK